MKAKFTITQKITFSAMLLVLAIFSTLVFKLIWIPGLPFVRFSLTPAIIIYTSLTLGPLYGAIVGVGADLIPALIEPFTSGAFGAAINPLVTVVYGLLGVLPWALSLLTRKFRGFFKKPWVLYFVIVASLAGLAGIFFGTNLLDPGLGDNPTLVKWILLGVYFLLDVGLVIGLHFTEKYFQKRILDLTDIPSPNETAFICVISELVLMVIAKSLAFYVYYMWISASGYEPLYTYLFASLLLISPLNILVNTFVTSWMMVFTRHFIHSYGYPDIKEEGTPTESASEVKNDPDTNKPMIDPEDVDPIALAEEKKTRTRWIIFFVTVIVLMIACIIVITVLGK